MSAALKIHQYWDSPTPPDEVVANIRTIERAAPDASLTLLDKKAAEQLVAQHHGSRALGAFRACGPPAMQADYLRLCIMDALGGLYIDADDMALEGLDTLIGDVDSGLLVTWINIIENTPLFFKRPKHPFISACLTLATQNIEAQRFDSVLIATGPAVLTAIYCAGDKNREEAATYTISRSPWNMAHWRALLDDARDLKRRGDAIEDFSQDLTIIDVEECKPWITNSPMAYKASAQHWQNWSGSIYKGAV